MTSEPVRPATDELRQQALDLIRGGQSLSKTAKQVGYSIATVSRWAKRAGVKPSDRYDHPGVIEMRQAYVADLAERRRRLASALIDDAALVESRIPMSLDSLDIQRYGGFVAQAIDTSLKVEAHDRQDSDDGGRGVIGEYIALVKGQIVE